MTRSHRKTLNKKSVEIWKIQRPVASSHPNPQFLVYNKGKRRVFEAPAEHYEELFPAGALKIYVLARYEHFRGPQGLPKLNIKQDSVEEPDW